MALKSQAVFDTMAKALASNPSIAEKVKAIYQFTITSSGSTLLLASLSHSNARPSAIVLPSLDAPVPAPLCGTFALNRYKLIVCILEEHVVTVDAKNKNGGVKVPLALPPDHRNSENVSLPFSPLRRHTSLEFYHKELS